MVKCGIKIECKDTTAVKVKVTVEANKDTTDIMVGDWWTSCRYSNTAPTTDWLLMPVCYDS